MIRRLPRRLALALLMAGPLAARAGFPRFLDRSLHSTSRQRGKVTLTAQ